MARVHRKLVRERAKDRCEYCHIPQRFCFFAHEIDHIRARKHRGATTLQNTCFACADCNGAKGSNAAGFDPDTDALVPLFNPRDDTWSDHFLWDGPILTGCTAVGRATIEVLNINERTRVEHRRSLLASGRWADENSML
jgi:hypothetical protein